MAYINFMDELYTRPTLIEKIQNKYDENSWEDFVFYYQRYIYAVIRNMNIAHHDIEDLAQASLLKVWKNLPKFQYDPNRGKFRSWLCRIIKNTVIDFIRSSQKKADGIKGAADEQDELSSISLPDIEEIAEREWKNYISNMAWDNIKDSFTGKAAKCFLLLSAGKTAEEAGEELGVERNTVYVYKKRVQQKLCREINRLNSELE